MKLSSINQLRGLQLAEATYVELVRNLYRPRAQPLIMSASFVAVAALALRHASDTMLAVLTGIALICAIARLIILFAWRGEVLEEGLSHGRAVTLETRYAIAFLAFSISFGLWAGAAFAALQPANDAVVVALVFGFGAGVGAGVYYRPWISAPAIVLGALPTIIVAAIAEDAFIRATGLLLAAFLGGGLHSMWVRYGLVSRGINTGLLHASLARHDHLTGLPNRLALREAFDRHTERIGRARIIAVHSLDLDRLKPVNDRYGHPTGDVVLKVVADRLTTLLRAEDMAVRLGGDEFVVLQTGAVHPDEVEMLARRIARVVSQPIDIGADVISLGVSVGQARFPDDARDLDQLLAFADRALYRAKNSGGDARRDLFKLAG